MADGEPTDDTRRLETLDVGGSPGEMVPVRVPDQPSLLDFFATWCNPCRRQMDSLREVRAMFDPNRLHMLSITTETDKVAIRRFWTRYEGTWPVAIDRRTWTLRKYGVTALPTLVLVSAEGTVHWTHHGLVDVDTVIEQINRVLKH